MSGASQRSFGRRTQGRLARREHSEYGDTDGRRETEQAEQSSEGSDGTHASFAASEPHELGASTAIAAACLAALGDYCHRRTNAADIWRYGVCARPRIARKSAGV